MHDEKCEVLATAAGPFDHFVSNLSGVTTFHAGDPLTASLYSPARRSLFHASPVASNVKQNTP